MQPALPPEAGILPSVAHNAKLGPPLSPTNSQRSHPCPKTCHLGPSLLTPTHLHCLSTSTGHLSCCPYPSSNHHILLTISPKSYSAFQHPARVSAHFSKPCGSTSCPLRQLPSPYIPASTAANHPSRLQELPPSAAILSWRLVYPVKAKDCTQSTPGAPLSAATHTAKAEMQGSAK